jgi:hypothetical protein
MLGVEHAIKTGDGSARAWTMPATAMNGART